MAMLCSNERRWQRPGDAVAVVMATGALGCQLGLLLRHAAPAPPRPPPRRATPRATVAVAAGDANVTPSMLSSACGAALAGWRRGGEWNVGS